MTEQDENIEPESHEGAGAEQGESQPAEADGPADGETDLSDIAVEPDGDVDEALSAILASERGDEPSDGTAEGEDTQEGEPRGGDIDVVETVDPELVDQVEAARPETVARIVATLRRERKRLTSELDETRERAEDFESRLKRKQADFQNYKKRQQERLEEEKQRATEDLVTRLLDVRDNLERALDQDEDVDIRGGVETTLGQFDDQLERENVSQISPEKGQETDPQRHEVLATVDSDQPEDTIAAVHRTGYEMGGKVLRPAQVVVSAGSNGEE